MLIVDLERYVVDKISVFSEPVFSEILYSVVLEKSVMMQPDSVWMMDHDQREEVHRDLLLQVDHQARLRARHQLDRPHRDRLLVEVQPIHDFHHHTVLMDL